MITLNDVAHLAVPDTQVLWTKALEGEMKIGMANMGQSYSSIDEKMQAWIEQQQMYFVGTAPLAADGHINCSPKGLDSFAVLGPNSAAYLDLTGSGAETIAHLRENGRIVIMFCAFEGAARIVRLHGRGTPVFPDAEEFSESGKSLPRPARHSLDRQDRCGARQ